MATKAMRLGEPILVPYTVAAGQSVPRGAPVFPATETTISQSTAATAKSSGVAYSSRSGVWPATEGDVVDVALLGSPAVVPILVGTGGATAGEHLVPTANGATNATTGGGTAQCNTIGQCMQTGVLGDLVGCNLAVASPSVSA